MADTNERALHGALTLAANGLPVFVLKANSKHEYRKGHPLSRASATLDVSRIREWFGARPSANVGWVVPSGCVVVDVDVRNGGDTNGHAATFAERTASGGLHLLYKLPNGMNWAGQVNLGGGIELFGTGQKLVGAGSIVTLKDGKKGIYTLERDEPPADAPGWVVTAIARQIELANTRTATSVFYAALPTVPDAERGRKWAERGIDAQLQRLVRVESGKRFVTLRAVAYRIGALSHLSDAATSLEAIYAGTANWREPRKVRQVAVDAFKAGQLKPSEPKETPDNARRQRDTAAAERCLKLLAATPIATRYLDIGTDKHGRRVRVETVTAHAVARHLASMAIELGRLEVDASTRELSERMHCMRQTAARGLKGAARLGLIRRTDAAHPANMPTRALRDAQRLDLTERARAVSGGNAARYVILPDGFVTLHRDAERSLNEPHGLIEKDVPRKISEVCAPFSISPCGSLSERSGAYARTALGPRALLVLHRLAARPYTSTELADATGMRPQGVRRIVRVLLEAGIVERSAERGPITLAADHAERIEAAARMHGQPERAAKRRARHDAERAVYRAVLERPEHAAPRTRTDTATLPRRWAVTETERRVWRGERPSKPPNGSDGQLAHAETTDSTRPIREGQFGRPRTAVAQG